jgi:hypothetical protein
MARQLPFRAPSEVPISDKDGRLTRDWSIHLELSAQQLKTPANQTPPPASNAPGQFGQIALDAAGNLYVYVGTKWMRIALQNF